MSAILYDLIKKVHKKLKENQKKENKIHFFTEEKEYVITGKDSDSLPE